MVQKVKNTAKNPLRQVYIAVGLIVIIFFTSFADPFNVPKQIALLICSSYLSFELISKKTKFLVSLPRIFLIGLFVFVLGLLISALLTKPLYFAFFGENLRRNGLLTSLGFLMIFLSIIKNFEFIYIRNFYNSFFTINIIVSGYGILQILNLDFVSWTKSGGIIGTLGNSNFAGVVYAFLSLISLGSLITSNSKRENIFGIFNFIVAFICLINTNARQSILIFIFGSLILCLNFENKINKPLKVTSFILIISTSFVAIFGIFNVGPLASTLYKNSIGVRIYYWKAAIKMFMNHPIFGVGIDRYGSYFKEYRESSYPLKYGFDLTSNNAHNVFLQQFATTGIVGGSAYLFLMLYIFYAGVKLILNCRDYRRPFIINIFAVWFSFQLQSLVSIDNIGVAIFNWVFSGLIIASYQKIEKSAQTNTNSYKKVSTAIVIRPLITVPSLAVCLFLAQVENSFANMRIIFNPSNLQYRAEYVESAKKILKKPFLDPQYRVAIANSLLDYQEFVFGKQILDQAYISDPRDLSTLWGLALYYEIQGDFREGLKYRSKIELLDPWNAKNYLQMVNDYLKLDNRNGASRILDKINSFASKTDEAKNASLLIAQFK